ncbi:hypothetical protein BV898_16026 [Hypsibius exemplaris]|uniref:Uncharacterized protein n=1 Tax=Hypsibius exemplaris TaxID=2072580 RepID=A0A9X6RL69_HYPEX|nr:hypothetical protein BV898_16026 [Hypsibius exemplaris]
MLNFTGLLFLPLTVSVILFQAVNSGIIPGLLGGYGNHNGRHHLLGYEKAKDAYEQVFNSTQSGALPANKSAMTVEVVAAAVGFKAFRMYQHHRTQQAGPPPSWTTLQDLLAEFASTAADKVFEAKGMEFLDKKRVRTLAMEEAKKIAEEKLTDESQPQIRPP